jgi:hypothetical protein
MEQRKIATTATPLGTAIQRDMSHILGVQWRNQNSAQQIAHRPIVHQAEAVVEENEQSRTQGGHWVITHLSPNIINE